MHFTFYLTVDFKVAYPLVRYDLCKSNVSEKCPGQKKYEEATEEKTK